MHLVLRVARRRLISLPSGQVRPLARVTWPRHPPDLEALSWAPLLAKPFGANVLETLRSTLDTE